MSSCGTGRKEGSREVPPFQAANMSPAPSGKYFCVTRILTRETMRFMPTPETNDDVAGTSGKGEKA
jgi:hypothetical protein